MHIFSEGTENEWSEWEGGLLTRVVCQAGFTVHHTLNAAATAQWPNSHHDVHVMPILEVSSNFNFGPWWPGRLCDTKITECTTRCWLHTAAPQIQCQIAKNIIGQAALLICDWAITKQEHRPMEVSGTISEVCNSRAYAYGGLQKNIGVYV